MLHLGERARRLSKNKPNQQSDFVRGDVPRELLFQLDLDDDEPPPYPATMRLASSAPNAFLFPARGLSPWARGRAASAEDVNLTEEDIQQKEVAKQIVPRKTVAGPAAAPKWVTMRANRKSLEMEDVAFVAEMKRKNSGRIKPEFT